MKVSPSVPVFGSWCSAVKAGVLSLGIEAPATVAVHRVEVHARFQEQNRLAAEAGSIPVDAFSLLKQSKLPTTDAARSLL